MNDLEPLYDGVRASLLAELRLEWIRYGWDEQDIDEKLAKLSRLWSAAVSASRTTVPVALADSQQSNKRKRDAQVRNDQKKQKVDTTTYDTKPLSYAELARAIQQTDDDDVSEHTADLPSAPIATALLSDSSVAVSAAELPSVKSEPSETAIIPPAPIQLPYAGSIHVKSDGALSSPSPLSVPSVGLATMIQVLTVEELNSADDDSSDDDVAARSAASQDVCVCTYDKVTHSKNRWKIQLRDGMLRVRGKDYVFAKANGEMEW